jgi:uncharacterized protein (DUF2267 family)
MRYANFISTIEQVAGIDRDQADRAARAVLETLAERITGGEARDIAVFAPKELRPALTGAKEPAEAFDLAEFLRRVAGREGVDTDTAREHARAVFVALGQAVAPGEIRDMVAQLPRDFGPLLDAAGIGRRRAMDSDQDLVTQVAQLAGLDPDEARRATEAVLETLAVRISDGEVEDLEEELTADLRPALERGLQESRAATHMTADEFVRRVAEREGVDEDTAREHARAVFAALRRVISGEEFSEMAAQLSKDYELLLTAAG